MLMHLKGTVHQMYECTSDVLLHLDRMLGIVFMVQIGQIWPKSEKMCFDKMYQCPSRVPPHPSRSASASSIVMAERGGTSRRTGGTSRRTRRHFSKDAEAHYEGRGGTSQRTLVGHFE